MLFHADVEREQNLVFKALVNELSDVACSHFIGRVTISFVANVVNAKKHALVGNLSEMVRAKAVPEMADHNASARYTLFSEQSNLLQRQFAEMSGMGPNRHSRLLLRSG